MLITCLFISIVSVFISLVLLIGYSKTQGNKTTMRSKQIKEKSMDYIREQYQNDNKNEFCLKEEDTTNDLFKNMGQIIEDDLKRNLYCEIETVEDEVIYNSFKKFLKKDNID